jgi:hypothetical protein
MNQTPSATSAGNTSAFKFLEVRPGITMVLLPDMPLFTIIAVSNDFEIALGRKREEVVSKSYFEVFPENQANPSSSGIHSLKNSFNYILEYKTSHGLHLFLYVSPVGVGVYLE